MEVGAVAAPHVACVERVAAAPSGAALVIRHHRDDVLVDDLRLLPGRGGLVTELVADLRDASVERHQLVGAEKLRELAAARLGNIALRALEVGRFLDRASPRSGPSPESTRAAARTHRDAGRGCRCDSDRRSHDAPECRPRDW